MKRMFQILGLGMGLLVACSGDSPEHYPDASADDAGVRDASAGVDAEGATDMATDADAGDSGRTDEPITVVTFNTGTGPERDHDVLPDDGYGSSEAEITDRWYGNGLSWPPLVDDVRAFFDEVRPDIVVFQEIFWSGECPSIPLDARDGFVCEGWSVGDPTVAQLVLGDGYQVACHPGKPDKCAAVRRNFGTFPSCDGDFCLEGMSGSGIDGCGRGARVARIVIEREDGPPITVVNFHGSSGFLAEDQACRVKQVEQVFVDLGDGMPGANGAVNLVLGDLNTDPGRLAANDPSAARWLDFVGDGKAFDWLTAVGPDATPTYAVANIDHVVSDVFSGTCWHGGIDGRPAVSEIIYFDHRPAVCELEAYP